MPETIRQRLRSETADEHAALDRDLGRLDLASRANYAAFLSVSAEALFPLEDGLVAAGVDRLLPDWTARSRVPALAQDLTSLGLPPPERSHPALPLSEPEIWGALYVLEGSRLGARVLVERARSSPDDRIRAATRYLAHGEGQRLWQSFLVQLEGSISVRESPDIIIMGAKAAFEVYTGALRRWTLRA